MPERETKRRAKRDLRQGKSASTAAGEYVREEMDHIRRGKHGARSAKQAIAIGLSKARRSGVPLKPNPNKSRRSGASASAHKTARKPSRTRSRASERALKREPREAASHRSLSKHARSVAKRRGHASLSAAARKAARTRSRSA